MKSKRKDFARANREAARLIAASPERYPGALQQWAQMVLLRSATLRFEANLDGTGKSSLDRDA
jgi:hypothetical protein